MDEKKSMEKFYSYFASHGVAVSPTILEDLQAKHNLRVGCEDSRDTFNIEMLLRIETGRNNNAYILFDALIEKFRLEQSWKQAPEWFGKGFVFSFCPVEERFRFSIDRVLYYVLNEITFSEQEQTQMANLMEKSFYEEYRVNKAFNSEISSKMLKEFVANSYRKLEAELNEKEKNMLFTEQVENLIKEISLELYG